MHLEADYLNKRIELFDHVYDAERERQYNALGHLYNLHIGPVTLVNLHRPSLLDLSMYSSSCRHAPLGSIMQDLMIRAEMANSIFIPGGGKGISLHQPLLGALGEVSERLLAVFHFAAIVDHLEYATYEELMREGRHALSPEDLPLFASEQYSRSDFAYEPYHSNTPLRWIEGIELLTEKPILVPAQLVSIYYKHHPGEAHIGYPTTGGLAFHTNRRRALLHGLYEYIERDAINICWYCKIAPPRVRIDLVDFLDAYLSSRNTRLATPHINEITVLCNTIDVPIPIFTTIAVDRSRRERAFMGGGGAWSNRERALVQALFEIGQSRTALKFHRPIGMKHVRADSELSEMTDFFDAALFFGYAENLGRLSWYTASKQVMQWETVPTLHFEDEFEEYEAMLGLLQANGLKPIVFDFSGACWPGVSVTKVFVPQLTQACIPAHPYLGHPRFYELPQKLKTADRMLTFTDLNSEPVPFP